VKNVKLILLIGVFFGLFMYDSIQNYSIIDINESKHYKSNPEKCKNCSLGNKCTVSKKI
jgi:hypothetical protein